MANIKLILEYDGSGFHGWQIQPGVRTIQAELHKTLELVLRTKIATLYAAGRTDAGVHARAQVVNFFIDRVPDLHVLKHSVSGLLKGEVSVLDAIVVPDSFHARDSARSKQYQYTILYRPAPAVLDKGKVWHISSGLNVARMQEQAKVLEGVHDFSSLRAAGCASRSPVREIFYSELCIDGPYLRYVVVGSGFLKQMVRNIVGTLVALGKGPGKAIMATTFEDVLAAKDRRAAGMTAPAHGLCLDWVKYE